ncbi:Uncharacterised protein [Kluyvera ascorbata]|jgi:hypothetical protein|nr:hypothetical protein STW0522KLE44_31700 [Klebsiella sp. STW0522-44]STX00154.1 Uncharacterised protein [Kluyvera ascorbata]
MYLSGDEYKQEQHELSYYSGHGVRAKLFIDLV